MSERAVLERIIAVSLGAIGIVATLTMAGLAIQDRQIPNSLSNVAIAVAAGLAGALAIPLRHGVQSNGTK